MKVPILFREDRFLDESLQLTDDQEKHILNQFLTFLQSKEDKDPVELELVRVLTILNERGRFHLQLIDRSNVKSRDLSAAYGYYSAYENIVYLVVDKSNFESKWLGLATNFNMLQDDSIRMFVSTCIHELIHYTCTNHYQDFIMIWNSTFRQHLWNIFSNIVNFCYQDFVEPETFQSTTQQAFLESTNFRKAFDTYYNSLLINIKFRYKSIVKRYNDILSTLYSKHPFEYARFFDNILISTIKLQNGDYSDLAIKLYRCIHKAYIDMEPELASVKMNELFYQEMLDFSEISCVFANHYKNSKKYSKLVLDTLKLI